MESRYLSNESFQKLLTAAVEAGREIMSVYDGDNFDVSLKDDNSPLTIADRKSNHVICDHLEQLAEGYPIISEENKDIDYADRKDFDKFWLVDPLDGTKEFIKRNGEFTVNIALIADGRPEIGIVYVPATDTMYYAIKGQGAWIIEQGQKRKLEASRFRMSDPGLNVVCSRSHLNPETQEFIDKLREPGTVSKGSSLKFLILAEGKAHLYPRIAPTMEWDTGAAQCVLEEAGGKVVEYESGTPLRYNKQVLLNPYFLATGKVID